MSQLTRDRIRLLTSSSPHTDGDKGQYDGPSQLEALDTETIYHLAVNGRIKHSTAVILWGRLRDKGEITERLYHNLVRYSDPAWRRNGRRTDMTGDDRNG